MRKTTSPIITQQDIKAMHLKQIYLLCLHSGGISRAQLRREMGLSFPAVSALVDELIEGHIIEEVGVVGSEGRGRPSIQLCVCADSYVIPAVMMGFDGYDCRTYNFAGEELSADHIPYNLDANTAQQKSGIRHPKMEALAEPLIRWLKGNKNYNRFVGLVFSAPGSVDESGAISASSQRLETPAGFLPYLEQKTGLKCYVGNDADHYAYMEYHYNKQAEDFALILISNGVGSAVVRNGRIFETKTMRAGEFGHISIDYKGRLCACGSKGCLECYISTLAMAEEAGMDFGTLCKLYQQGDPRINALVCEKAEMLAIGLNNMLAIQPMKQIVIGGIICGLGPKFLEDLRRSIQYTGFRKVMRNLNVRYAIEAAEPEILGAMWNFVENEMEIHTLLK